MGRPQGGGPLYEYIRAWQALELHNPLPPYSWHRRAAARSFRIEIQSHNCYLYGT